MKRNTGSANARENVMTMKRKSRGFKKKKTLASVPTTLQVNRMIERKFREQMEMKSWYTDGLYSPASAVFPTNAGVIVDLSDIPQGIDTQSRIGEQVTATSLEIRWNIFSPNTTAQSTGFFIRLVAFIFTATVTTPGTILHDTTGLFGLTSPFAITSRTDRKILWDYSVDLFHQPTVASAGSAGHAVSMNNAVGSVYIPLNRLKKKWTPMTFNGIATTGENHVYMLILTNILAGTQAQFWNAYVYSVLNFRDA